jgi:hypothetical protein
MEDPVNVFAQVVPSSLHMWLRTRLKLSGISILQTIGRKALRLQLLVEFLVRLSRIDGVNE